jgi:hypothetical protein
MFTACKELYIAINSILKVRMQWARHDVPGAMSACRYRRIFIFKVRMRRLRSTALRAVFFDQSRLRMSSCFYSLGTALLDPFLLLQS